MDSISARKIHEVAVHEVKKCMDESVLRIRHCTDQLSDAQIWWRPGEGMNSIGNLLLHVAGNIRQWVISGIEGSEDTRQRPSEFAARGPISKQKLLHDLESVVEEAKDVLTQCSPEDLLARREIQGFDVTGWGAILNSVPHLQGHTQEIICLTRMQLQDDYRYYWQPS